MKRTTLHRSAGLAALVLTASMSLTACGSDDGGDAAEDTTSETSAPMEEETPGGDPDQEESAMGRRPRRPDLRRRLRRGPEDGDGSFDGMSTAPVATAASANPVLKTLVAAVTAADLVDTLNSAPRLTVFAPTNEAFGAIPKKDLNALLADKPALTKVLTHHVVEGKIAPEDLAGTHKTLAGDEITVEGSGEEFTVGETPT